MPASHVARRSREVHPTYCCSAVRQQRRVRFLLLVSSVLSMYHIISPYLTLVCVRACLSVFQALQGTGAERGQVRWLLRERLPHRMGVAIVPGQRKSADCRRFQLHLDASVDVHSEVYSVQRSVPQLRHCIATASSSLVLPFLQPLRIWTQQADIAIIVSVLLFILYGSCGSLLLVDSVCRVRVLTPAPISNSMPYCTHHAKLVGLMLTRSGSVLHQSTRPR